MTEKQILESRAKQLALPPEESQPSKEVTELLEFQLASERYGVELGRVREVQRSKEITPVPGTPGFIVGIINVRGQIMTVVDLKTFFGLSGGTAADRDTVIILESNEMSVGILADHIADVRSIDMGEVQPALTALGGIRQEYLRGVTNDRLIFLDVEKLLGDKRMTVNEQVEA